NMNFKKYLVGKVFNASSSFKRSIPSEYLNFK
ncbi:unnamed protein product, partial [marine sediment metagenome]